eukprot:4356310-Pleurochrysis_carterae.AAC.1
MIQLKNHGLQEGNHEATIDENWERAVEVKVLPPPVGPLSGDIKLAAVVRLQPGYELASALALRVVPLVMHFLVHRADERVDLGAHPLEGV